MKTETQWKTWFETFHSNTLAGSGNQSWFECGEKEVTGRVFYRLFAGGDDRCSLLFGDAMDTTFADGSPSRVNQTLGGWTLRAARIGVTKRAEIDGFDEPEWMTPLTFDGEPEKHVAPGERFASDPVRLRAEKGDYLCLETTVSGPRVPCHPETLLPCFVRGEAGWTRSVNTLFAQMIGCDRPVRLRVGFLGDSITQGCGTRMNRYEHWSAVVSERLGEECAFWNLGLGYARAHDAAACGDWLERAKRNDLVVLCAGVNDLFQRPEPRVEDIERSLQTIVTQLRQAGARVLVQTIPPFDYDAVRRVEWAQINDWIRGTLSKQADALFDVAPVLRLSAQEPWRARYGGHPDGEGCRRWAEALEPVLRSLIEKTVEARRG